MPAASLTEKGTLKRRIKTLYAMNDDELRAWMRRVWLKFNPLQVSDWYDQWEVKMFGMVSVDFFSENDVALFLGVQARARRITHSITTQPPYQAMKP
jgi:hypothetical protein